MSFRNGYQSLLSFIEFVADALGIFVSFYLAHSLFETQLSNFNSAPYVIAAIILIFFLGNNLYRKNKTILNIEETRLILKSLITSALVVFALLFLSEESRNANPEHFLAKLENLRSLIYELGFNESLSRSELIASFVIMFPLISLLRYGFFKFQQSLHRRGIANDRVLIYGKGDLARHLFDKIAQSPKVGYYVIGLVSDIAPDSSPDNKISYLGSYDELRSICKEHKIDRLIVADSGIDSDRLVEILRMAQGLKIELEFVPAMHSLFVHRIRLGDVDGLPLISVHNTSTSTIRKLIKRFFDVVFSLVLLIITTPLFAIAYLCIKIGSKGPALFKQDRTGYRGNLFTIFKFRTMKPDSNSYADTPQTSNDERITTSGRWLRRFSLDELPQLINVLKGDMSLVGPRPEMPFITEKYSAQQKERLRVKPGITGLWQISADRKQQIHENLDYDLYYIEHQSLLLDIVILIRTFFSVIRGIGSY